MIGVPAVVQWVKAPALLQLWCGFEPWPGELPYAMVPRKKEKKIICLHVNFQHH